MRKHWNLAAWIRLISSTPPRQARRRRFLPAVEALESRQLLTTVVSRVNDDYLLVLEKVDVNGTLIFSASDAVGQAGLWKTDGTPEGTVLIKEMDHFPEALTNVNGTLFFRGEDGNHGIELWKSDGTAEGTVMVKDINPSTLTPVQNKTDSFPNNLTAVDGVLYFAAYDGVNGTELWKSDGTEEGTVLLKNINPNPPIHGDFGTNYGSSRPTYLQNVEGTLYFAASDGTHGYELWKSDGTEAGTQLVKDIFAGEQSSGIQHRTVVNGQLYFTAKNGTGGNQLWTTDGTEAGTHMVKQLGKGGGEDFLTDVDGVLYFRFGDQENGFDYSLWKTDGTEAGTVEVSLRDLSRKTTAFDPEALTSINGTLFFVARDKRHTVGLWKIEGTTSSASLVKTFSTDSNFYLGGLAAYRGELYFQARADGSPAGVELWKSDGTEAGTQLLKDIKPGEGDSFPGGFVVSGEHLYFDANDGTGGRSLWAATYLNQAPTDLQLSSATVANHNPPDSLIGTLSTVDPDRVDSFTYSLVTGTGGTDNASFSIEGDSLFISVTSDRSTQSSYSVRIRATDEGGLFCEKTFTVTVKEPPAVQLAASRLTVAARRATPVDSTALVIDADSTSFAGGSLTVSIALGKQSLDVLNLNSRFTTALGQLKFSKGSLTLGQQVLATVSGGVAGQPLTIQFRQSATRELAQDILRNVTFSGRTRGIRTLSVTLTDETGLSSGDATREVQIA